MFENSEKVESIIVWEEDMGLIYKAYQHIAYEGLEWAREGVDYKTLDKHWDDLLQECHDNFGDKLGRKSPTSLR